MENNELRIYLVVNESLNMSAGKIAAQCGHAVQLLINKVCENNSFLEEHVDANLQYIDCNKVFTKIVLRAKDEWDKLVISIPFDYALITDDGRTEVPPNSQTVIGIGPITKENAKPFVGHLKLL